MTQENIAPEITQEVAETQTAQEEPQVDLAQLQETLKQLEAKAKQYEDNWKNEQRNTSKKSQEVQQLREKLENNESQQSIMKALVATIASQQGKEPDTFEGEVRQKQPDLMKAYEEIEKKRIEKVMADRALDQLKAKILDLQARVEDAGLTEGTEEYEAIKDLTEMSKFASAEKLLAKYKAAKQTVTQQVVAQEPVKQEVSEVTKAVEIDTATKEKYALEYMKEKGLLKQGAMKPSGNSQGRIYSAAEISDYNFWKANKDDIEKAREEGRIKS